MRAVTRQKIASIGNKIEGVSTASAIFASTKAETAR